MEKKLLILGGATPHRFLTETAKEMGLYTIVTDYLPPERSPAKLIADEHWELSITDVDGLVERCRAEGVDAVLNVGIDPAQRPYQAICERLGLPCYGTEEQFYTLTDKKAFKAFCRECGVDTVPDHTLEECRSGNVEYPVFVKPVDSRSSRGQHICHDFSEVESAIEIAAAESSNGEYLIEKYFDNGSDFVAVYLFCDGKPYLVMADDRYFGNIEDGLSRQAVALYHPSRHLETYLRCADPQIQNMLGRLGIRNGPVMLQGFLDGETFRPYDPSFRFGGSEYTRLYTAATGQNPMRTLIEFALGRETSIYRKKLDGAKWPRGKRGVRIFYDVGPGKVATVEGITEVESYPGVVVVRQKIFAGDTVQATGDTRQRACEIAALVDDSPQSIIGLFDYVYSTLRYTDEGGKNMQVSPLDARAVTELYFGRDLL